MNLLIILFTLLIGGEVNSDSIFKLQEKIVLKAESFVIPFIEFRDCFIVDSSGNMWIRDGVNRCLLKFSSDGKFLKKIGREGSGSREFKMPTGICIDKNDRIYMSDVGNRRISVFDSSGKFLNSFTTYKNYCSSVKVDFQGNMYTSGFGGTYGSISYIHKFNRRGTYIKSFYQPSGTKIIEKLPFSPVVLMDIGNWKGTEYIYIMNRLTNEISIFTTKGKELKSFFYYPPYYEPPITPKKHFLSSNINKLREWINKHTEKWTEPRNLVVTDNGYMFVVYKIPNSPKPWAIEIFDGEGNHIIGNIRTKYFLLCADRNNYIYFQLESPAVGERTIGKYSFNIPTDISQ